MPSDKTEKIGLKVVKKTTATVELFHSSKQPGTWLA